MYCEYYGFSEKPFTITPNSRFVFLSKNHREAFAHLLYGIENRVGFIQLTGEVGTGKTTVLRTLLGQLGDEQHHTALIFNPSLTADELLPLIAREFGITGEVGGNVELLNSLYQFLLKENAAGRSVVLVMDEAQNLSPEVMEQVRLISNLETETEKLIQIVLAGQPELEELLDRSDLRQIRQRIAVRFHLRPMDFEDTCAYVRHRLEVAGGTGSVTFTPTALRRLYASSGGTPRLINVYCDRALLIGYGDGVREIGAGMMAQAVREVSGKGTPRPFVRPALFLAAFLLLVCAMAFFGLSSQRKETSGQVESGTPANIRKAEPERKEALPLAALNHVLAPWHVSLADRLDGENPIKAMKRIAKERGLYFTRFNGTSSFLGRLDMPALLEDVAPGSGERRYLALTGREADDLLVSPAAAGRERLAGSGPGGRWSGPVYIPWKDPLQLSLPIKPGARGGGAGSIQRLLKGAGFYGGAITAELDQETVAAIRRFQASWGITVNGKVAEQTLLLLLRASGDKTLPLLGGKTEEGTR